MRGDGGGRCRGGLRGGGGVRQGGGPLHAAVGLASLVFSPIPRPLLVTAWLLLLQHRLRLPGRREGRGQWRQPLQDGLSGRPALHLCLLLTGQTGSCAPTPSCREAGKRARCRPQCRWGQWAGHELAHDVLVTLSQTKPSVSAFTRELRSLSKCGLSSYDAPGSRDTGWSLA